MSNSQPPILPEYSQLWQDTLCWQPSRVQQQQFQALYQGILLGNQKLNLTRITQPEAFWEKHLWDSLWGICPWLNRSSDGFTDRFTDKFTDGLNGQPQPAAASPVTINPTLNHDNVNPIQIIDIGTGAGFPGLPVAIALPHRSITLLDSVRKKIAFLDTLVPQLGLTGINLITGRAEAINTRSKHSAGYHLALVRAVSTAPTCAQYTLPFLQPGGYAVLYRGQWTSAEAAELTEAVEPFHGTIEQVISGSTPISQGVRHCIYIQKNLT
ncbi:MAG: 16S rRNA (guanine(527)-N(7))-methyltransferase RsmG [Oscillatoriales cyanobacterium RM2_1_1]|nr:16S rRNA (guanine(527)-N(7))-methyltransferase RsmG [Oscillatoriales cyanobacterium SM2_3_0]NJO47230.1 16S rRNA (guanine(527)-N(7))-methyltransferase RsmG [Oscillatoriales cyanobacterium RM2_1_1]